MWQATLDLISLNGVPVTHHASDADDQQAILDTIDRAEKMGLFDVCTVAARHVDGKSAIDSWY